VQANQSIERAAALLHGIAERRERPPVANLARLVDVSPATASRMLMTLERLGFVERSTDDGTFQLGAELARLGRLADPHAGLLQRVEPFLRRLSKQCGETVTLSVRSESGDVDVIRQIPGSHFIGDHNWVGLRPPHHATSNGKVFLAELPAQDLDRELASPLERFTDSTITDAEALREALARVRDRGHSTMLNELEEGLSGVSVGVRTPRDELAAVVSVSGPSYRFDEPARERALARLRQAVDAIQASWNGGRPDG
jgi:DNA-binding IclR family transcriptional regulator